MTTSEILTRVTEISKLIDAQNMGVTITQQIHSLRDDLAAQLRYETSKQCGRGNAVKSIENMLKPLREQRPALSYPWIDSNGRQCVCDGFRAYRLTKHLPLIDRPADVGNAIDLDKIFPANDREYVSIPMPEYNAVKSFIAIDRAENGSAKNRVVSYKLGFRMPTVDARYLLDMMTVFPNATEIKYIPTAAGMMKPLIVQCDDGDGIVLPIRSTTNADWDMTEAEIKAAAESRKIIRRIELIADWIQDHGEAYTIEFDDFAAIADKLTAAAQ